ncbi:MAG: hypothetical protein ACKOCK_01945 [Chloroflexota bacterium]
MTCRLFAFAAAILMLFPQSVLADELEAKRDRIAAETAVLRMLPPLDEIDDALISTDELRERMPALIARDYPEAEALADQRILVALGLIPADYQLLQAYLDLLVSQVAGFYDPVTDEMYVISDTGDFGGEDQFTYAHETVHALQDAAFDLEALTVAAAEVSDDASLALSALVEGDATLAANDYLFARPELTGDIVFSATGGSGDIDTAPAYLSTGLLFPYLIGLDFVTAVRDAGGWDAVNSAYADPPTSTEQVMHPERYLDRDEPTSVVVPDLAPVLGGDWRLLDANTLGEFTILQMLADLEAGEGLNPISGAFRFPVPAMNAAAGWDGDQYAFWVNGEDELLRIDSVWDTPQAAAAFSRAMAALAERRFHNVFRSEADGSRRMDGDAATVVITLDGTRVTYVQSTVPELAPLAASIK